MDATVPGLEPLALSWLPAKALRGLQRHAATHVGERLYLSRRELAADSREPARFVLRVDDFPRWDIPTAEFASFHALLTCRRIPYLLGVTPFLCFDGSSPTVLADADVAQLRDFAQQGVELGLHGFTHRHRLAPDGQPSETYFYDDAELLHWIERAFAWFASVGLPRPTHYIPPFNTLGSRDYRVLARHFSVVHGGPLSLSTLGKFAAHASSATKYCPSYEPFYGRAARLVRIAHADKLPRVGRQVLTLHWAWERATGYHDVEQLLDWLVRSGRFDPPRSLA